jgi:hypothetical protein
VVLVSSRVFHMKSNEAAWRALSEPVSFRQAAKLLGTSVANVERLVAMAALLTIEVRGREMVPACELRRFRPSR